MMHECQGCGLEYMGEPGLQECVVCKDKPKTKPVKQNGVSFPIKKEASIKLNLGFQSKKVMFKRKKE